MKSKAINQTALFETTAQDQQPEPSIAFHPLPPDDPTPFTALLTEYAAGRELRAEVVAAIWQWSDPLQAQITAALEAAERHGEWKARNF